MIHLFNVDRGNNFTIKKIFTQSVTILINDKDGVLIKVNKNKKSTNKDKIQ